MAGRATGLWTYKGTASNYFRHTILVARLQGLDPPEQRTDSEVVGKRLPVLIAGSPDLLAVGGVQPGVVPYDRPACGSPAAPGRADRWVAHPASLAGRRDRQPEDRFVGGPMTELSLLPHPPLVRQDR
jgi:hypothetical protein